MSQKEEILRLLKENNKLGLTKINKNGKLISLPFVINISSYV